MIEQAFETAVEPHRAALLAHCYRMLGSLPDAEDALQETLLRAWRAADGFEGRSALRSWLHAIASNVCLRALEKRPQRTMPLDYGPPTPAGDLPAPPLLEAIWVDPYPDTALAYEERESIELSFVAALQHLPPQQRAVLILREVLGFSAAETATTLETTVPAVNSALQRARRTVEERSPQRSQFALARDLGDEAIRKAVAEFADAWERADVDAVVRLLADDVTMTMPPMPTWYAGRDAVGWFLTAGPFASRHTWSVAPIGINGQPGLAHRHDGVLHSLSLLEFDAAGRIAQIAAFLDTTVLARFS